MVKCWGSNGYGQLGLGTYDQAIKLDPQYAKVYNARGISYRYLREYRRAIQNYDQVIKLNSQNANTYYNRGGAFIQIGDKKKVAYD